MVWIKHRLVCILLLSAWVPAKATTEAASAQPRLALVIGNSSYQDAALRYPKNDASDMADVLDKLGFDVTV